MSKKKSLILGVSFSTATHRLSRQLMFEMAKRLNLLICFRCSHPIDDISHFSIDHKMAWERADDPVRLFFDLDNIAFSHLRCNSGAALKINKKYASRKAMDSAKWKRYNANPVKSARRNERRRDKRAKGSPH